MVKNINNQAFSYILAGKCKKEGSCSSISIWSMRGLLKQHGCCKEYLQPVRSIHSLAHYDRQFTSLYIYVLSPNKPEMVRVNEQFRMKQICTFFHTTMSVQKTTWRLANYQSSKLDKTCCSNRSPVVLKKRQISDGTKAGRPSDPIAPPPGNQVPTNCR